MRRFLLFALPSLVLVMALFNFALETFGLVSDPSLLARLGGAGAHDLPSWVVLGTWILEALALAALFLLAQGRDGGSLWNGLLAAWIAWVFRGPLLVITVAGLGGLKPGPWWGMVFWWWILYTLCGLLLGALARSAGLGRPRREELQA
ncbi:MAG TPA: hypothetical protein VOA87_13935 [Thermoanaerobaculia bacterium]|nr:hypothetical protein [Thermoanaerobaculia bacterium]